MLTVFANDSDHGRSGKVTYGLVDNAIVSYFIIDGQTGIISTIQQFDYEKLSQTVFTFTVIASDDGSPRRTAEATVVITIQDRNDNCPVFKRIPVSYNVPLKSKPKHEIVTVESVDVDSEENGKIEYDIDKETNPDNFFGIGKVSGKLFVNKTLEPGKFSLTVLARDLGSNPCIREIALRIVVDAAIIPSSSAVTTIVSSTSLLTSTFAVLTKSSEAAVAQSLPMSTSTVIVTSTTAMVKPSEVTTVQKFAASTESLEGTVSQSPPVLTSSVVVMTTTNMVKPSEVTTAQKFAASIESSEGTGALSPPTNSVMSSLSITTDIVKPSAAVPTKTPSPRSSTTTPTSSVILTSNVTSNMVEWSKISTHIPLQTVFGSSSTSLFPSILVSSTTTPFMSVKIEVRLTNKDFDDDLQNNSSQAYRDLRDELNTTLRSQFGKIEGFLQIISVKFRKGSVIAELSVKILGSNEKYNTRLLRQAIINGTDSKGNIGELTFDIAFLKSGPQGETTSPPTESGNGNGLPIPVYVITIIGGGGLMILIATVFAVSIRI